MANLLEALPSDILHHIALQATINSHPMSGTRNILSLLLTSSTFYHTLCIKSCPHLYADIFRAIFDTGAIFRRFKFQVTDSQLANELVIRFQMLRRVRGRSISTGELRRDLWTALWMIYESDCRNESYLRGVCLPEYLLEVIKHWGDEGEDPSPQLRSLVIWTLCFTLTQQHVLSLMPDAKATLQHFLLPYSRNIHGPAVDTINSVSAQLSRNLSRDQSAVRTHDTQGGLLTFTRNEFLIQTQRRVEHGTEPIVKYGREWLLCCPDPTPAAISLLFCLKETDPIFIPDHLPETRLIALATQRSGPTKEDLRKIRGYKTKLLADTVPPDCRCIGFVQGEYGNRSEGQDFEFRRILSGQEGITEVKAPPIMCGMMTGVWEGFYMIAPGMGVAAQAPGSTGHERRHYAPADFVCRKPMQSVLAEYVCFAETNPAFPVVNDESDTRNLPRLCSETEVGFELDGRKYERLVFDPDPRQGSCQGKATREPVDVVLLGETIEDHEQAWGGFRFAGRIRKDGSILLKREAKEDGGDAFAGTWVFEGRLCFGTVFVGTCSPRATAANNSPPIRGIFSMQKRAKESTSW